MDLHGARVLDLYAGSGAMGLEALSRGAKHARFVESDRRVAEVLRRNVARLGLSGIEVTVGAVEAVLQTSPGEPYDLVLADPPYALGGAELTGVLAALLARGWPAPGALMVVERSARSVSLSWPAEVVTTTQRRYGDTCVHYGSAP